ncbi:MAG: hypothetical protein NDJ75_01335 [Thermoanaerobaculia bacterium]|nr:hypothetical protein [Thermoanaerobaculia bacterium]
MRAFLRFGLLPVAAGFAVPSLVLAQAWLPPKGTAGISVTTRSTFIVDHAQDGDDVDVGHTRQNSAQVRLGYGLTDRLFTELSLPYVRSEYHGDFPHHSTEVETVDDSRYRGFFTDFRVEVRFAALDAPLVITPFASFSWPSRDYPTLSHAAPATGLEEWSAGVYLARALDPWSPGTYVQASLGYVWPEKVIGISHDRIEVALEVGHFFTPAFSLSALGSWFQTYGGWTFAQFPPRSDPDWIHHDQLWKTDSTRLGAGFSYTFGPKWGVYGSYMTTVHANEGHVVKDSFLLGVSMGWLRSSALESD